MMHRTGPLSRFYDEAAVVAPSERGHVAWSLFNEHYARFQAQPWRRINEGVSAPWWRKLLRLGFAFHVQRTNALLDLETKAKVIARLPLPRDPDVVFFGAEVGWEAMIVRALFGSGGRCVLVDCDPNAHARFVAAPRAMQIRAPARRPSPVLQLERDEAAIEYVREDFFVWSERECFDLGIDWGLLEHYPGDEKTKVLERFRVNLRPSGVQLSAVPRDSLATRLFYSTFPDELNFGYRELLTPSEHTRIVEAGGFRVLWALPSQTTSILAAGPGIPSPPRASGESSPPLVG